MKALLQGFMIVTSSSSFASKLKPSEMKIGQLANYYNTELIERVVGRITKITDKKVEITAGRNVVATKKG
jgi:hypothetical protein